MATQSTGIVKSFSIRNGYGFITDQAGGEDLFFGKEQIPTEWQALGPKLEGYEVVYDVGQSNEGKAQARNVRPARAPTTGQVISGVVKSWNSQKGFGFMQSPGLDSDVFFGNKGLPVEFRDLQHLIGTTMVFTLAQGPDGKLNAQNMCAPNNDVFFLKKQGLGQIQSQLPRMKRPFTDDLAPAKRMNVGLGGRQTGVVKSFSSKNGFGFIVSSSANEDIIFYSRDLQHEPQQGENVEFVVRQNSNGRPQAHEIRPAGASGERPSGQNVSGQYPPLTIDDIKLYAEQLSTQDLSELSAFTTQTLQARLTSH